MEKKLSKWSKNRFFMAMLLALTLTLAIYFYLNYQKALIQVSLKTPTATESAR